MCSLIRTEPADITGKVVPYVHILSHPHLSDFLPIDQITLPKGFRKQFVFSSYEPNISIIMRVQNVVTSEHELAFVWYNEHIKCCGIMVI